MTRDGSRRWMEDIIIQSWMPGPLTNGRRNGAKGSHARERYRGPRIQGHVGLIVTRIIANHRRIPPSCLPSPPPPLLAIFTNSLKVKERGNCEGRGRVEDGSKEPKMNIRRILELELEIFLIIIILLLLCKKERVSLMEIRWEWGCSYWDQGLVHGGNYRVEKGMEKWGEGWRRNFSTLDPELRHIHHCSCRPTFFLYFPFFHFLFLLTGGRRHLVNSETRRRFHAMTHLTAVATQKTATGSTANPASTSMYTERERERERERFRTRYIHIGNKRDKIFLGAKS